MQKFNPNCLVTLMGGLLFISVGGVFLAFFLQRTEFECQRRDPVVVHCDLRVSLIGLVTLGERSITDLQAARLADHCTDDCTYRVELETNSGVIALTEYFATGPGPQNEMVQAINDFLAAPQQQSLTLRVESARGAGWFLWFLGAFILAGMGLLAFSWFTRRR